MAGIQLALSERLGSDGADRVCRGVTLADPPNDYAANDMPAGSAVRNRSEIVTVVSPRGQVEVARQEVRGLRRGSSWTWFWLAHRKGGGRWTEASTAREAIRRAMLLPPGKLPAWLYEIAAEAERQVTSAGDVGAATTES